MVFKASDLVNPEIFWVWDRQGSNVQTRLKLWDECGFSSKAEGNQCRLTLTAVFVLREDVTVIADTQIRPRSVLTGAVWLAETSVCSTFVYV